MFLLVWLDKKTATEFYLVPNKKNEVLFKNTAYGYVSGQLVFCYPIKQKYTLGLRPKALEKVVKYVQS